MNTGNMKKTILLGLLIFIAVASLSCATGSTSTKNPEVDALIQQLGDSDRVKGGEASTQLYKLSMESDDVIPSLVKALRNDNPNIRADAVYTLWFISTEKKVPEDQITRMLKDKDISVRVEAAKAVGYMHKDAKEVLPILLEGMEDEDYYVRFRAIMGFVFFGHEIDKEIPQVIPNLLKALGDENPSVRHPAGMALKEFGEPAVPGLIEALGSVNPAARDRAADTLGGIGHDAADAVPALINTLKDDEPRIRHEAAIALTKISEGNIKEALPILIDGLNGNDGTGVQSRSAEALAKMGPAAKDAIPVLLEVLETANGLAKCNIAFALTQISKSHVEIGINALIEELGNEDASMVAVGYLGDLGQVAKTALPKLKEMSEKERIDYVRVAILNAISKIEEEQSDAETPSGD